MSVLLLVDRSTDDPERSAFQPSVERRRDWLLAGWQSIGASANVSYLPEQLRQAIALERGGRTPAPHQHSHQGAIGSGQGQTSLDLRSARSVLVGATLLIWVGADLSHQRLNQADLAQLSTWAGERALPAVMTADVIEPSTRELRSYGWEAGYAVNSAEDAAALVTSWRALA
ncbi:MAG: hypothetical protein LBV30_08110 [Propionibacteriaceae bacterium]|jgi:hypothetical protein|nr:hypothetical protein [Propionibacteriaceae bacterium]